MMGEIKQTKQCKENKMTTRKGKISMVKYNRKRRRVIRNKE